MIRQSTITPLNGEPMAERKEWVSTWDDRDQYGLNSTMDNLKVLLHQEADAYLPCEDYLSDPVDIPNDGADRVSEAWRRKLCEWCFEVVDHFSFDREVVSYALNYLDRVVAIKTRAARGALPKRDFQLLAVTSLYLAIKLHGEVDEKDSPRRKLRIGAFVELSRGFFSAPLIEATELQMLESLQWRVNPPTSLRFIASLLRLCPVWSSLDKPSPYTMVLGGIYDVARYLTELAVCVSSFSFTFKTSVTAYASILCAIEALQPTMPLPYHVRVSFLNTIMEATGLHPADPDVRDCCARLKELCPSFFNNNADDSQAELAGLNESVAHIHVGADADDGKVSPVSVIIQATSAAAAESPRSHRKRSRAGCDDDERPVHRSAPP